MPGSTNLYTFWPEYGFRIGGRIAAKTFTSRQPGRNRYDYRKRRVFWDLVTEIAQRGYKANNTNKNSQIKIFLQNFTIVILLLSYLQDVRTYIYVERFSSLRSSLYMLYHLWKKSSRFTILLFPHPFSTSARISSDIYRIFD